jgi:TusA-related sulfurtransferase
MVEPRAADRVTETDAPAGRSVEVLDARELPPPRPLRDTLERLAELEEETVLVQVNDRVPRHLFPALAERGYAHDTVETETGVVTAVWRA